ncbi:CobW family GTP-binding protein [Halomonas beimenensis]|uniref:Putative metal chaperone, involved in Zn homeostasis, GTPase of COG0523 family n=1 Tax=Halomonas beimenensis TaxID=475662 RepID=A0A291P722_9GAMM|nr:GTP-binding protein [Halomonas beimenensis]ATJ82713.1 putative metal chaperone, involved in Zn homeostasis, GTPase of COG0523 family [Halomonas beimenensis]
MPTPLTDIPVHPITGFLGSGKSSLIRHLIEHKPEGERWAVLINEFGRVGIDQALVAGRDDVVVRALPGGCLCCQLATVLQAALVELLRRERPDRLIIEPSGLGHPAGLLDLLQGEAFAGVLALREVVAVLDPRRLEDPRALAQATFRDQLALADGIALTMTDLVSASGLDAARDWLADELPGDPWVEEAPHGRLPIARVLGSGRHRDRRGAGQPAAHRALTGRRAAWLDLEAEAPRPGHPVFLRGEALGQVSLGWRWHPDEAFDRGALLDCLDGLAGELRLKGVFRTGAGWMAVNRVHGHETPTPSEWRRDSRLEVIGPAETLPDPRALQARLAACLL